MLFVDDEDDILRVVKKGLEKEGFYVDIAASAEEATTLLEDIGKYDIVVIDIRMPKMNGFQLYDTIKSKIDDDKKIKVCFFTAFTNYFEEYQRRFPKWDGCCFLIKPMSVKLFAAKLRELISEESSD